ncbi:ras guanine nucleotide exchange factor domain-containing protein [Gongronella butleri]|nr:ras guanine nucleotide exchange factor domain-containing protein [Gongronella butleri]
MTTVPEIICRVRALYPFESTERASLTFQAGDEIDVLTQLDSGWWDGWCNGKRGWFPCNFTQVIQEGALNALEGELDVVMEDDLLQQPVQQQAPALQQQQQQPQQPQRRQQQPQHSRQPSFRHSFLSQVSQQSSPPPMQQQQQQQPMDHRLSFLAYPQQDDDWRTKSSSLSTASLRQRQLHQLPQSPPPNLHQHHQFIHDDMSDTSQDDLRLPHGWTLVTADGGATRHYYNHLTGAMRFKHPALADDDSDQDGEPYSDDDETSYRGTPSSSAAAAAMRHPNVNYADEQRIITSDDLRRLSIASSDDETAPTERRVSMADPIMDSADDDNSVEKILAAWVKRETPQGRAYFCNLITQETTWDEADIDTRTGRLISAQESSDASSDDGVGQSGRATPTTPTPTGKGAGAAATAIGAEDEDEEQSEGSDGNSMSWATLSSEIATAIHHLNSVAQQGLRDKLLESTSLVVETIRLMLYASGSMEKDATQTQDPALREPRRAIMSSLSKLVLSSKMAAESLSASAADTTLKVQRDASDVLSAVRNFVTTCQQCQVNITSVSPHLIDASHPQHQHLQHHHQQSQQPQQQHQAQPMQQQQQKKDEKAADGTMQKAKYPLNQDLVVSLRTHANQIYGSTDALSTSVAFLLTLYRPPASALPQLPQDPSSEAIGPVPLHTSSHAAYHQHYEDTDEEENAKANVIHLFRSLSGHLSQFLSILEDIDIPAMDNTTLQLPSLHSFRTDKQALYNAVGRLFGKVQQLTDQFIERQVAVSQIDQAVEKVERAMESLLTDVGEMVLQRHAWMVRQGEGKDAELGSPILYDDPDAIHPSMTLSSSLQQDDDTFVSASGMHSVASTLVEDARRRGTLASLSAKQNRPKLATHEDKSSADWFLGPDYKPDELVFSADGSVKGGTIAALVERLTMHDSFDTSYITTFLLTYRSFCGTEEFINLLQDRYNLQPPDGLTPEQLEVWTDTKQKLVRLRVFNVLKNWLENYYDEEDEYILGRLEFFTNTVIRDASPFSADQLNRLIRKRKEADSNQAGLKKLVPKTLSGPLPILPKNIMDIKLLEADPLEMARQLSILDFKLYSGIRPIECLNKAWSRDIVKGGVPVAINVIQSIDYCNRLTSWVTDTILSPEEAKKRVVIIKYWAQVAEKCRNMNNYNTCMAIISAFDNSAIGRLKKTWELLGGRTSQVLSQIRKLMGANRNFTEYREMIHSVNPPCIPFLGIYLQDLTFIEDGNPDYLRKSDNLINFAKRQKCAEVIQEIKQFQSPPYTFHVVPQLQDFIKSHLEDNHDVESLYERSLLVEPREIVNANA